MIRSSDMEYKVVLQKFEGPLDLLYHLIEKSEVDIYDIPIAEIADQYINYLNKMEELDLDITSEFLVMAATLLEIKSKMLLPKNEDDGTQLELEEVDPREELVKKLIEYRKYKYAAEKLKLKEDDQKKIFYKPREEFEVYIDEDEPLLEGLTINDIISAFNKIIEKNISKKNTITVGEIKRDEITIEESMEKIISMLKYNKTIILSDLFDYNMSKPYIVVTFLSILELIKLKHIIIFQRFNFDEIIIKKNDRTKGGEQDESN